MSRGVGEAASSVGRSCSWRAGAPFPGRPTAECGTLHRTLTGPRRCPPGSLEGTPGVSGRSGHWGHHGAQGVRLQRGMSSPGLALSAVPPAAPPPPACPGPLSPEAQLEAASPTAIWASHLPAPAPPRPTWSSAATSAPLTPSATLLPPAVPSHMQHGGCHPVHPSPPSSLHSATSWTHQQNRMRPALVSVVHQRRPGWGQRASAHAHKAIVEGEAPSSACVSSSPGGLRSVLRIMQSQTPGRSGQTTSRRSPDARATGTRGGWSKTPVPSEPLHSVSGRELPLLKEFKRTPEQHP